MRLLIALAALLIMFAAPSWAEGIGAADEDIQPDGILPMELDQPLLDQPAPGKPSQSPTMPTYTTPVRVLLSSRTSQLEVGCKGAVLVWDAQGRALGKLVPPVTIVLTGGNVKARDSAGGFTGSQLTISPLEKTTLLRFKGREYRGCFRASTAVQGGVLLLNVLDLENYLRGVVPSEMPALWHPEAVKAQAVAARTYALKETLTSRAAQFDVTADVSDQVYLGAGKEHPASDAAIKATEGLVGVYNGVPIIAYYHSSSGGKTRRGTEPYLIAVPSPENSPYNNWELEYTLDELGVLLEKAGRGVGTLNGVKAVPAPEERDGFRIGFWGEGGTAQLTTIAVRKMLGINTCKSPNFKVETLTDIQEALVALGGSQKVLVRGAGGETHVKLSSAFAIGAGGVGKLASAHALTREPKPSKVRIAGHGYGHGLGMSQYGAKHMAEQGADWRAIIQHYYTGVQVIHISKLKLPGG